MMKKQTKKSSRPKSRPPAAAPAKRVAPVAVSRTLVGSAPRIQTTARSCVIKHQEMIGQLGSSGTCLSYAINPGVAATFPWLASLANQWEMYRFRHLAFEYVPACSTATNGRVLMAVDYDALDPAPADYPTLAAYDGATSGAVWSEIRIVCPPSRLGLGMPQRFTRQGSQQNLDLKTYDLGNFFLWPSPTVIGEVWVDYEVELMVPQIRTSVPAGLYTGATAGLGSTAVFNVSSPLATSTGAPLLAPVLTDDPSYDASKTKFRALDTVRGIVSLYGAVASGDAGPLVATAEKLAGDVTTQVQSIGFGTLTSAKSNAVSWLVNLERGALLALTKPISTVLTSVLMPMVFSPLDRASYASFKPEL